MIDLSLQLNPETISFVPHKANAEELFRRGHFGTHLDVHLQTEVPLEYMHARGVLFDVSHVGRGEVQLDNFSSNTVRPGDFVLFRTGMIERETYGSREYFIDHTTLSQAVLNFLVERHVHFIGIDAPGVRRGQEHVEADQYCESHGIYIIENLINLDQLAAKSNCTFSMTTAWWSLPGQTGLPCRVVAKALGEQC